MASIWWCSTAAARSPGAFPGTVRLVDLDTRKPVARSRAFSVEACIGRHLALMAEPRAGRGARDG